MTGIRFGGGMRMYRGLGVAVIALCGLVSAACGGDGSGDEAGTSTATPSKVVTSAEASTSAPESGGAVYLGPTGYGALKLGMTRAQAVSGGLITVKSEPPGGCGTFDLKQFPRKGSAAGGYLSAELGIAAIFAVEDMSTPEGIAIGSSEAEVKKAYPQLRRGPNTSSVTVPGNPKAVYSFLIIDGRVKELVLDLANQNCHN